MTEKMCVEMKWLRDVRNDYRCPDCLGRTSAITGCPGVEECRECGALALMPNMREQWEAHLPMMADYEVEDGKKRLLGWHPKSEPEKCFAR